MQAHDPGGVEVRIVTLEADPELEEKGEGLAKGRGRAIISRTGVVDSYGDVIEEGAFSRKTVDLLPNHSWNSPYPPIGAMTAVPKKGTAEIIGHWTINTETMLGKEWLAHLRFTAESGKKAIQEFSIGFRALKARWLNEEERAKRKDNAWRVIEKLDLLECSMVVSGAMPGTQVIEMRQRMQRPTAPPAPPEPAEVDIPIIADLKRTHRMVQDFPWHHHIFRGAAK